MRLDPTDGIKLTKVRKPRRSERDLIVREAVRTGMEQQLLKDAPKLISVVLNQALNEGCRMSQKMLIDRLLPSIRAIENTSTNSAPMINIEISQLGEKQQGKVIEQPTFDQLPASSGADEGTEQQV